MVWVLTYIELRIFSQSLKTYGMGAQIHRTANVFSITQNLWYWGTQKNRLMETVILSTHNICFG